MSSSMTARPIARVDVASRKDLARAPDDPGSPHAIGADDRSPVRWGTALAGYRIRAAFATCTREVAHTFKGTPRCAQQQHTQVSGDRSLQRDKLEGLFLHVSATASIAHHRQ